MKNIEVKLKDENVVEVNPTALARAMSVENFVDLFSEFINIGMKDYQSGVAVGDKFQYEHRTIQGSAVRFMLGFMVALGKQQYTDARNEIPVETCRKIAEMLESGELKKGMLI